ncbi:hypothetical protein NADFUDRAFT_83376 [Nadsonia fulvescens var. elongata DSM 6958]|uniref:Uncharacterized protein n=1 Tax=Nadsonia fulvescens var. elongata DSM 6958 TaxID=857566 RepID=A0A1E3PJK3_9ASCO|nr:hypothetical protein NADFUDRAFT_83376 [Nadsonia fulvescens var. elongata DSM 6958]
MSKGFERALIQHPGVVVVTPIGTGIVTADELTAVKDNRKGEYLQLVIGLDGNDRFYYNIYGIRKTFQNCCHV